MLWAKQVEQTDDQNCCRREFLRMRHTEITECGKRTDGRRNQIISNQKKRADNRDHFRAMPHGCVHPAAVEDRGSARNIDIARTPNACWNQNFTPKRDWLARRAVSLQQARLRAAA